MTDEPFAIERGSGNVYRDLGKDNPVARQLKSLLAAEIIKCLDRGNLSVRGASALTGVPAADFCRIRNADLARFSSDRLIGIISRFGSTLEISVKVKRARKQARVHA